MVELSSVILLALVGTWAALDGTAVGQFLVARPLVAATLAGWVLGDATSGLLVGLLTKASISATSPPAARDFRSPGRPRWAPLSHT